LKYNADGSLTIYVQADPPLTGQHDNWLPAPKSGDFSLYVRRQLRRLILIIARQPALFVSSQAF
jgi:hypothetical protein